MPVVWRAQPHEAETVGRLLSAFRSSWGHDWPSDNAILASVERLITTRDAEYLLAATEEGAEAQGVTQIRFRWSVWMAAEDCALEDLFVDAEARGTGLGRALVDAVYERAKERGCRRIELDVRRDNPTALALYESVGFEIGELLFTRRRVWENLPPEAPFKR